MNKDSYVFLQHILDSTKAIENYTKNCSREKFLASQKTKDAVIRNIEIIGEAAKHIPEEFKINYGEIPWKDMVKMRDKVIHDYLGVDWGTVWDVVKRDLPELKEKIMKIMKL